MILEVDEKKINLDGFVDGGVELELLCAFGRLEADDQVRDGFAKAADRVLSLDRAQLCHLAFVNL